MFHSRYNWRLITCCLISALVLTSLSACKKYLDHKANNLQVIPSTLADCQQLLDNYFVTNGGYPINEQSTDNYYINTANWNTQNNNNRDLYIWAPQTDMFNNGGWLEGYQKVMYANTVLETLNDITPKASEQQEFNIIKGEALFFRAFSFYMMAQIWAQPYKASVAQTDPGIPLRLSADISIPSTRATVQQTYDQIINDFKTALQLLPDAVPTSVTDKTRPSKPATYAALARTYLTMSDYTNAGLYADSCLKIYNTLMDYNQLDATAFFPVPRFNTEVMLDGTGFFTGLLSPGIANVDSTLHHSYAINDLRLTIFFRQNSGANANTYQFRGNYAATSSAVPFCGFAADEMYLTRAECAARAGNIAIAMDDLNTLLQTRWVTGTYIKLSATDASDALSKILSERRKELLFRAIRWADLRRLNMEPEHAVTLSRIVNGTTYSLPPNDLRYTMLIPQNVLKLENLQQNPR